MALFKKDNEADVRSVSHLDLIKAGVPETLNYKLLSEIIGRSVESLRASAQQGKLTLTRGGLFEYLNSPGKQRFRENFFTWAEAQKKRGLYSLSRQLPQPNITISEMQNA